MNNPKRLLNPNPLSLMGLQHQSTSTPWTEKMCHELLENPLTHIWGMEIKGHLESFLMVQKFETEADIVEFVVNGPFQNKGIGAKLYDAAEKFLQKQGVATLFLEVSEVNIKAKKFYETRGFKAYHMRPNYYKTPHGKVDALLMKKELSI